jgi:DNA-binding transcriptional ArsR family regulator
MAILYPFLRAIMTYHSANPDIKLMAEHLSVLGNANRLAMLEHLSSGELQVSALAKMLNLGQSALSQHLAVLRACQFVTGRRASQAIFYSIRKEPILLTLERTRDLLLRQSEHLPVEEHPDAVFRG